MALKLTSRIVTQLHQRIPFVDACGNRAKKPRRVKGPQISSSSGRCLNFVSQVNKEYEAAAKGLKTPRVDRKYKNGFHYSHEKNEKVSKTN